MPQKELNFSKVLVKLYILVGKYVRVHIGPLSARARVEENGQVNKSSANKQRMKRN